MDMNTYAPTSDPCVQIKDQRDYMAERYVTWSNARAHWESYNWW